MTNVVDALSITLELDASQYVKGAAEAKKAEETMWFSAQDAAKKTETATKKQTQNFAQFSAFKKKQADAEKKTRAERERAESEASRKDKQRQNESQKGIEGTIGKLKALGLYASAAVLGFDSIKGAISAYNSATNELAQAGRFSKTVGASVNEVTTLANALKQVGGSAQDAQSDLTKLAHAQFSIQTHTPDQTAGYLASRLGIQYTELFDKNGKARDQLQLLDLIGDRIRGITKDRQQQAMLARELGLSEASIQLYVLSEAAERAKITREAKAAAAADEKSAASAARLQSAKARLGNVISGFGARLIGATSGGLAVAADAISNTLSGTEKGPAADAMRLEALGINSGKFQAGNFAGAKPYASQFAAAEKKYGLPAGLLANVAHQESNFNPNAVSSKGAVGLMQLMPKYFKGAGNDVGKDIDTAAQELSRLYKGYSKYFGPDAALDLALAAYNGGQGNVARALKGGTQLSAETRGYVPSVTSGKHMDFAAAASASPAASGSSGGTTSVQIDNLTVTTQAKDAHGVARELPDALRRKGVVAQANTGMT